MEWEIPAPVREISILITGDSEIHKLNKKYRGKDKATDILSFPQITKSDKFVSPTLGDLVISLETAKRQAIQYKHAVAKELERLLLHGILHLLGYDHEKVSPKIAAKMRRKEKALLKAIS